MRLVTGLRVQKCRAIYHLGSTAREPPAFFSMCTGTRARHLQQKVASVILETKEWYSEKIKISEEARLAKMSDGVNRLEALLKDHALDAEAYVKKRDEKTQCMAEVQEDQLRHLAGALQSTGFQVKLVAASSFTDGTHIDSHSDIDIHVLVDDMSDQKLHILTKQFEQLAYRTMPMKKGFREECEAHHMQGDFTGFPVELKIRERSGYEKYLKLHDTIRSYPSLKKNWIAYLKKVVQDFEPQLYHHLKVMLYCDAGYRAGVHSLIFPLLSAE